MLAKALSLAVENEPTSIATAAGQSGGLNEAEEVLANRSEPVKIDMAASATAEDSSESEKPSSPQKIMLPALTLRRDVSATTDQEVQHSPMSGMPMSPPPSAPPSVPLSLWDSLPIDPPEVPPRIAGSLLDGPHDAYIGSHCLQDTVAPGLAFPHDMDLLAPPPGLSMPPGLAAPLELSNQVADLHGASPNAACPVCAWWNSLGYQHTEVLCPLCAERAAVRQIGEHFVSATPKTQKSAEDCGFLSQHKEKVHTPCPPPPSAPPPGLPHLGTTSSRSDSQSSPSTTSFGLVSDQESTAAGVSEAEASASEHGDSIFPSEGSRLHGTGSCTPCAWFWKSVGCQWQRNCSFCHSCPETERKNRKKSKVNMMRNTMAAAATKTPQAVRPGLCLASLIQ